MSSVFTHLHVSPRYSLNILFKCSCSTQRMRHCHYALNLRCSPKYISNTTSFEGNLLALSLLVGGALKGVVEPCFFFLFAYWASWGEQYFFSGHSLSLCSAWTKAHSHRSKWTQTSEAMGSNLAFSAILSHWLTSINKRIKNYVPISGVPEI